MVKGLQKERSEIIYSALSSTLPPREYSEMVVFLENGVQEEKTPHGFSLLLCPVLEEARKVDT